MPKRKARERGRLSREAVLRTALRVADEGGAASVTMQRLGTELGVEAMSLYRHVRNKDDILDGIVDIVFAEIDVPRSSAWKAAMRRRAIAARQVLTRHPWAIGLMESRARPGPANLRHHDSVLAVLREAGFSSQDATRVYNVVNSYIYGFALQERSLPVATPDDLARVGETILRAMPANTYPDLAAVGADLMASRFDYAKEFEFGLDLILDGLERMRPTPKRRARA